MKTITTIFLSFLLLTGCKGPDVEPQIKEIMAALKAEYISDPSLELFTWSLVDEGESFLLTGETTSTDLLLTLKDWVKNYDYSITMSVKLLPEYHPGSPVAAVAKRSVVNLRATPRHSAELVNQVLMGTPMKILQSKENWILIQTPERYISWVDRSSVVLMQSDELKEYYSGPRVLFTDITRKLYAPDHKKILGEIVLGNTVKFIEEDLGEYKILLPSGESSYVNKNQAILIKKWEDMQPSVASLLSIADRFSGIPYLWGGTSIKAADCSGYTKNIYFLNGITLPRDADQQRKEGELIDSTGNFENLKPGDLVFFGRKAENNRTEYASHVGMYIGDGLYTHSSGSVHLSSFDPESKYFDTYNRNRYLRSKRIIGTKAEVTFSNSRIYSEFIEEILSIVK